MMDVAREGLSKGKFTKINLFEVEASGGLGSSLRNFSDFPFPKIGFSTFSEASL
jgi:hypothetical protein